MQPILPTIFRNAPKLILGAFFMLAACKAEEKNTPSSNVEESKVAPTPAPDFEEEVRFLSYNLENYLTMTRHKKGGGKSTKDKPEEEKVALVEIIVSAKPHILGVCEIGTPADLTDLQKRLKDAGLDLPYTHHAGGVDKTRKLALLSVYPIKATNSQDQLSYELGGSTQFIRRGILDVTIDLPFGPTHFIGVHFKSKREIEGIDQELIRLNEALLTRKHCDAILENEPDTHIIVYGDFNDTRRRPAVSKLKAHYRAKNYLEDLMLTDSRGEFWTHFWNYQHQYARFDYVLVSRSLKPQVDFDSSSILDPKNWKKASDHRAVLATFKSEIPIPKSE